LNEREVYEGKDIVFAALMLGSTDILRLYRSPCLYKTVIELWGDAKLYHQGKYLPPAAWIDGEDMSEQTLGEACAYSGQGLPAETMPAISNPTSMTKRLHHRHRCDSVPRYMEATIWKARRGRTSSEVDRQYGSP